MKNEIVLFENQTHELNYYNLDVILSVGYRVKSNLQKMQIANSDKPITL